MDVRVTLMDEATLERMAHIVGNQSAACGALADVARRRERGEDPVVVLCGDSLLVVPRSDLSPEVAPSHD